MTDTLRQRLIKLASVGGEVAKKGLLSRAVSAVDNIPGLLTRGVGAAVGKGLEVPAGAAKSMLFGSKVLHGPMAGTRMRAMHGEGSAIPISMERYKDVMSGKAKGLVHLVDGVPMERKTSPGGVVGLMRKHPIATALTGAAAISDNPIIDTLNPMFPAQMIGEKLNPQLSPTADTLRRLGGDPAAGNNVFAYGGHDDIRDPTGWKTLSKRTRYEPAQEPQANA